MHARTVDARLSSSPFDQEQVVPSPVRLQHRDRVGGAAAVRRLGDQRASVQDAEEEVGAESRRLRHPRVKHAPRLCVAEYCVRVRRDAKEEGSEEEHRGVLVVGEVPSSPHSPAL